MAKKPFISYLKSTHYLAYALSGTFLALSPVILNYYFDLSNSNNSAYDTAILTKHFIKISAGILLITGLVNFPFFFLSQLSRRIYAGLLSVFLYIPALLDTSHLLIFGARINPTSYYTIFSTHQEEALEFISDYSSFELISVILIIILISSSLYFLILSRRINKTITGVLYGCCYLTALLFMIKNLGGLYINELSSGKAYAAYREFENNMKAFHSGDTHRPLHVTRIGSSPQKETHIIVIGESTGKYHMGLYGYHRPTTPELEKIKNKLMIFNQAKTLSVHTVSSLSEALVLKDSLNTPLPYSIVDVFNNAGFKTYWLSNQQFLGENQALVSAIASRAAKKIFISAQGENRYDGDLLPHLRQLLKESPPKKIIFIHLMGTHLSYQYRYPEKFNLFREKNISVFGDHADSFINHYDNAILYNDFVLSEIIKQIAHYEGTGSVIYFSDHGDEVYDFRNFHGHSASLLSRYMTDIPFFIYGNTSFNDQLKEKTDFYFNPDEKEFLLHDLSHTLQDLYGIRCSFFAPLKSAFSKTIYPATGTEKTNTDSIILSGRAFPRFASRIWAHRVNTTKRLSLLKDKFRGFELDIVFENGELEIRHPPAESTGLTLDLFFGGIPEIRKYSFWLDLKNPEKGNLDQLITKLNRITKKYSVKNNIILETSAAELIPALQKQGYFCSYYLPDLAGTHSSSLDEAVKTVRENIQAYKPDAISQSIDNYKLMDQHFKNVNKLIWALNHDWRDAGNHARINNLLRKDSTIKVCLVNYETAGWR